MRWWVGLALLVGCYAPSIPSGAPCGAADACPTGLVCAAGTHTCERTDPMIDSGGPGDAARVDAAADAGADAATEVPVSTLLGTGQTAASGSSVALSLTTTVPAGTLLVLEVAARGDPPITITDSKQHVWKTAVEIGNLSGTSVAGIYYVVLPSPLGIGDTVTATVTTSNADTRALALFKLDNASMLDQTGSGQPTSTSSPSVTTTAAVTAGTELAFGTIVTGFSAPDSFAPGQSFIEELEFGTSLSSGSFNHKRLVGATGAQTFAVTTQQSLAAYGMVIATFR
ncbi:MAG: hypothetical protein IPQ07_43795 [Myxococcales bacterium]|nr:hypothetical protein [Myxococcales bacterium]